MNSMTLNNAEDMEELQIRSGKRIYYADQVANKFIDLGIEAKNLVTQMKLQKLVYFAHGLLLAGFDRLLIREKFQAWKYGPVVPEIYHAFKLYGNGPIRDLSWADVTRSQIPDFDDEALEVINLTWKTWDKTDGIGISEWTHLKDSPWEKVYKEGTQNIIIRNEDIQVYFKSKFLL